MNNNENRKDILFVILLFVFILLVVLFNFVVDPYYVFRDSTIKGFNNVKTHKYSSKRTVLYSQMKMDSKNKDIAFTGNCLLSHYGFGLENVAFFTIPVARVTEVSEIIKNIPSINPNIKTIYWGVFMDDFLNLDSDEYSDYLPKLDTPRFTLQDFINLFFSWNTTKYSIETVIDSIKDKGQDIVYIYPYREIAKKEYNKEYSTETVNHIQKTIDFAKQNDIELIIYYSPIHVSKKIHIYTKGKWKLYQNIKRELVKITPLYDYSFFSEYNDKPLDENSKYFIDNIHPTNIYNNIVVNDLLSEEKRLATILTMENIEQLLEEDTKKIEIFVKSKKRITEKLKNVKIDDFETKIKKE